MLSKTICLTTAMAALRDGRARRNAFANISNNQPKYRNRSE
jgi:hypothetical protein